MPKKITTKIFIERSVAAHGDKYDYSESIYLKSSIKVKIICQKHGEFFQLPKDHSNGKGCNLCGKEKTLQRIKSSKKTTSKFIEEAIRIHGDTYNYGKSIYTGAHKKITIICKKCGPFNQVAKSHIRGSGCPRCSIIKQQNTNLKKYGYSNPGQVPKIRAKISKTNMERYGSITPFANKDIIDKIKNTFHHNYGVIHPMKNSSEAIRRRAIADKTTLEKYGVSNVFAALEIKDKITQINLEKYGVKNYTQSKDYQQKLPDIREKIEQTTLKRYGVNSIFKVPWIKDKIIQTNIKKYGVKNYTQSKDYQQRLPDIIEQTWQTNLMRYNAKYYTQSKDYKQKLPGIIKKGLANNFPNIKYSNWKNLTADLIKEKFITDNQLEVKKLMDHIGWTTPTPVYQKCHQLGIEWIHSSGGFNPDKEATLYYLYDPQEDLYKIGITNKNASSRFGAGFLRDRKVEILMEEAYQNGKQALLAEQEILQAFKSSRTTNPTWPEALGGKTEFFNRNILEL
jgi:hypothetical protein